MAEEVETTEVTDPKGPCKCECCEHEVPEKPAPSWIWFKDTAGYPSVTVTFATVAFWVTTLAFLLSIVEKVGPLEVRPFDVAACGSYLIPILSLYFGRRWTDAKFGAK